MSPRWSSRCASGLRRSRPTASFRPPASKRAARLTSRPWAVWLALPIQLAAIGRVAGAGPAQLAAIGRVAGAGPANLTAAGSVAGSARSTSQPQAAWRGPSRPSSQPGWRLSVNLARDAVLAWLVPSVVA